MTLLTADDVLNKKFQATKFREGYEQDEVDEFLDEVVEAMRQLEAENADLKAKLDAANRRVAELGDTAARGVSEATGAAPVVPQQQEAPVAPGARVAGNSGGGCRSLGGLVGGVGWGGVTRVFEVRRAPWAG